MNDVAPILYKDWENAAWPAAAAMAAPSPPIDLVHLARQSLGDQDLERELLVMFQQQAARLVAQMTAARGDDLKLRAALAHTLKGSALAVGANRVAEAAARVEAASAEGAGQLALAASLACLAGAVSEAREAIARLLA
ncbi:MAG TPA: Hpt domain-containing protein [Roseiarcus sp.]|nr:Hpt domain-containing protein [Roseiarcus sp.]